MDDDLKQGEQQEWTPDTVQRLYDVGAWNAIAAAHNVALDTARQSEGLVGEALSYYNFKKAEDRITELEQQLAAERLKYTGDDYATMDDARNRILDLERDLAALKRQDAVHWKTRRTLLKELAAEREKVNNCVNNCEVVHRHRETIELLKTELAAEREKHKPLVEALKQIALAAEREKVRLLGSKHCPTTENELGDSSVASIHIEYYFPKGYSPDEEPWKSIKAHHNAALADATNAAEEFFRANGMLTQQLAAEREKVRERKAANDVLRDENRGLFAKCQALEEANKKFEIVILEGEETVDSALRAEIKQLRQQLAAEREVSLGLVKNLHDCEQQLAAEREKCKALVEAIESYLVKQRVQILKEALAKEVK